MIAASNLKSRGFEAFKVKEVGMTEIIKTAIPKTKYVCPTTLS